MPVLMQFGRQKQEDQEFKACFSWAPCQTKQNIINRGQHTHVRYSIGEYTLSFNAIGFLLLPYGFSGQNSIPSSSFPTETSHQPKFLFFEARPCCVLQCSVKKYFDAVQRTDWKGHEPFVACQVGGVYRLGLGVGVVQTERYLEGNEVEKSGKKLFI